MSKIRCFIAIDIESLPKIVEFENKIKQTDTFLKVVKPENIHITLKFLGDTEETLIDKIEEIIKNSVKGEKPFNIKLKSTGVFPNTNYIKVVWIGIEKGEKIGEIAEVIDEGLTKIGFKKEKRKFSAHLTITRVKSAKNKDQILRIINKYKDVEFADIKIKSIKLIKSELTKSGPIYSTLKEIKIGEE